ncbi:MAG: pantetheine-phosphate adenylyltransferase [Bacteroidaceae bacterium]|nr:pantetheine-phosphate adenylyltransferase [Bacteroidaceae bacterium]
MNHKEIKQSGHYTPSPLGEGKGRGLFPGSFDPFTLGHADLVERGLRIFGELIIAVGYNERKAGWIPVEERVRALTEYYRDEPRVRVVSYSGLTVELAAQLGATAILRGVRNSQDFLFEQTQADMNSRLSGIDTILLPTRHDLACISSSSVRELAHFGHEISEFLPEGLHYDLPSATVDAREQ